MGQVEAAKGPWGRVIWAIDASGGMPAREFFLSQSTGDQTKLMALFKRMADMGQIRNHEKFKRVAADLWEFKSHQLRFIGDFRPGGMFVIAYGLRKKQNLLRNEDIEKARRILAEHDAREGRKEGPHVH